MSLLCRVLGAKRTSCKRDQFAACRVLDHIGFDVKDLQSFVKKIEAEGIKLDEPVRKNEAAGVMLTYITDPWGTRIELVQRTPSP